MFGKLFGKFSHDIGIDLGTTNTLVYVKNKGIVISEPSVAAINLRNNQIIAIGEDARRMVGKTPGHIQISKPLVGGVISDFEVTEKIIRYFINKVNSETFGFFQRPKVIIAIPLNITEVERKAVEDAAKAAGARIVFLIEQPVAAAIGARLPIQEPAGFMIAELGGGATEIAVISLGAVVTFNSLHIAGSELDENIVQYSRENFNLLLGQKTAEDIKIKIGTVIPDSEKQEAFLRGRDLISGLPKEVPINSAQVRDAIIRPVRQIVEAIRDTLEKTPPELVADIYERGLLLSGGGANLKGLDKLIAQETRIPVRIIDDPLTAVTRGIGIVLEDFEGLKEVLLPSAAD